MIVNKLLYLFFVASASKKVKRFVDKTYKNDFMTAVHRLRQNNEYTDVTLQSDDVQIQCHRVVLAVGSKYFKAMFRCGLQECGSDTIRLTVRPEIMTSVVDYMYTGDIELTVDNVESLVEACDILQLDGLKAACEDFMTSLVDLANCVRLHIFAALYGLDKAQKKAKELMLAEFKKVAFSDQFKELSCSELVEIIKDDDIHVEDEDPVVESVVEWVRHDLVRRKASFETILEHTRLPFCTSHYLQHIHDMDDLLTPKCLKYIREATKFQEDIAHQHEVSSCRTHPRTHFDVKRRLVVVGGVTCSEDDPCVENNVCQCYNEDTRCWETLTEMPPSIGGLYSVCFLGRSLLLTGGHNGDALNQCWLYDLATKKWEALPPLITARYYHRSVSVGGCVYVVGGQGVGDNHVLASVECFIVKRRQRSAMPDLPRPVTAAMVIAFGNKVFVFGGRDTKGVFLRCTQVLDTTQCQWNTRSDSPEVCTVGAVVTLNDVIYVVGGGRRTCLKYIPATDTWTRLSRPRESHGNAPAVVWRGCILVSGDGGPNPKSSVIEHYDPLTDTWSDWKSELNMKLNCHDMFNVDFYDV